MDHDFLLFVKRQNAALVPFICKSKILVEALAQAEITQTAIAVKVTDTWGSWENQCLETTHGFANLQSARETVRNVPECRKYGKEKMERIMKQDLGNFLLVANRYATSQLVSYETLLARYVNLKEILERGNRTVTDATMTLATYQDILGQIEKNIDHASSAINVA